MSRPYEITKTEAAVKRYLAAFESGSLPEDQCATRVRRHGGRLIELRDRHSDLNEQLSHDTVTVPTPGYLAQVRDHVRTVLKDGTEAGRKAALLNSSTRSTSQVEIQPIFRVPAPEDGALTPDDPAVPGVRAPYRRVPPHGPKMDKR